MWELLTKLRNERIKSVLAIITETSGSTPRKAGSKLILTEKGDVFGSIGGGDLEYFVLNKAKELLGTYQPIVLTHNLKSDFNMACGGKVKIYLEPVMPKAQLVIFGAGHIGKELAQMALGFDFEVTLIDSRAQVLDQIEGNYKKINKPANEAIEEITFDEQTYICSIAHTHNLDLQNAALCLKKKFAYLGVIASKNKTQKIRRALTEQGFPEDLIDKIDMPMGIDIKAQTPKEIALAIMAKLIDVKNSFYQQQTLKIKTYNEPAS